MNNSNKLYSTVAEAAEMTGLSEGYIRELLNRGKIDKNIKLKGIKAGKEWRIDTQSIYEYLGMQKTSTDYEKELYIKDLEKQIKVYKGQIDKFKNIIEVLHNSLVIINI